jgi:plasmid stabilization system protein ParE
MTYGLVVGPDAKQAILDQRIWYHQNLDGGGKEVAHRWTKALDVALDKLIEHPTRFGPAPENSQWQQAFLVRQMLFRPWKSGVGWRVLFAIDESSAVITILQVRHESRPWLTDAEPDVAD